MTWGVDSDKILTFRYIQIEEIAVQNCLNDASNDCNQVIMTFRHVSVDLEDKSLVINEYLQQF
jgi:hypothetical protein